MRAFPVYESSYLADVVNQIVVLDGLREIDRSCKTWRLWNHSEGLWLEADEGSDASKFIRDMEKARKEYPLLDEFRYLQIEKPLVGNAVTRMAERTGTIILSVHDTVTALLEAGIQIVEDEPKRFVVLCSDDTFKQIVNETFPHWNEEE
tara:strand:+ start:1568 stop:2014 length:447 start_codon:yes stop_codon:yes gene_type:complete